MAHLVSNRNSRKSGSNNHKVKRLVRNPLRVVRYRSCSGEGDEYRNRDWKQLRQHLVEVLGKEFEGGRELAHR